LIFEESIFGPLYKLLDTTVFIHTNFGENILIGGDNMPPKMKFLKTLHGGGILLPVLRLTTGTYVCVIMHSFSEINRTIGGRVMTIQIIQDGHHPPF